MPALLSIEGVGLSRGGNEILAGVDLAIEPGEIHSVLGRNGTGKTSLACLVMGLSGYELTRGRILFDGKDIAGLSISDRARAGITLAWQEPPRFEGVSVFDYLSLSADGKPDRLDPREALGLVGMEPDLYLNRMLDEGLSGGERKRIELASVLAMRPRLAMLDEPDSGIDSLSIDTIDRVIRTIVKRGAAVLLITHRENLAEIADRASAMCGGKILKTGQPDEIGRFFRNHCEACAHINAPEGNGYRVVDALAFRGPNPAPSGEGGLGK